MAAGRERRAAVERANTATMGGALLLAQLLANQGANLSQPAPDPALQRLRANQLSEILRQGR